jgi:hypothetical protein
MSVALFDLKCPSYDYVKRMTWAEFRIRLHGFKRDEERKVLAMREMAWITYISPHQDLKKMKKSIDAFWPLKKTKDGASDKAKKAMMAAMAQYIKDKENGST